MGLSAQKSVSARLRLYCCRPLFYSLLELESSLSLKGDLVYGKVEVFS